MFNDRKIRTYLSYKINYFHQPTDTFIHYNIPPSSFTQSSAWKLPLTYNETFVASSFDKTKAVIKKTTLTNSSLENNVQESYRIITLYDKAIDQALTYLNPFNHIDGDKYSPYNRLLGAVYLFNALKKKHDLDETIMQKYLPENIISMLKEALSTNKNPSTLPFKKPEQQSTSRWETIKNSLFPTYETAIKKLSEYRTAIFGALATIGITAALYKYFSKEEK